MGDDEKLIKILKALSSGPRLEILEYLKSAAATPIEVTRDLKRNPSTIEQHLKILQEADIITRNIDINDKNQRIVTYSSCKKMIELLEIIRRFLHED